MLTRSLCVVKKADTVSSLPIHVELQRLAQSRVGLGTWREAARRPCPTSPVHYPAQGIAGGRVAVPSEIPVRRTLAERQRSASERMQITMLAPGTDAIGSRPSCVK